MRRSENSSARTWVIPVDMTDSSRGNSSVAAPGPMPAPWRVTLPAIAAASSGAASDSLG